MSRTVSSSHLATILRNNLQPVCILKPSPMCKVKRGRRSCLMAGILLRWTRKRGARGSPRQGWVQAERRWPLRGRNEAVSECSSASRIEHSPCVPPASHCATNFCKACLKRFNCRILASTSVILCTACCLTFLQVRPAPTRSANSSAISCDEILWFGSSADERGIQARVVFIQRLGYAHQLASEYHEGGGGGQALGARWRS